MHGLLWLAIVVGLAACTSRVTNSMTIGKPFQKGRSGNPGGRPKVVAEVKELVRESQGTGRAAVGSPHLSALCGLLIVYDESKMAALVSGLSTALLQCEKSVAQIDEGRIAALTSKFEFEQTTVERQSLFDIANPRVLRD